MAIISLLYVDDEEILLRLTKDYIENLGNVRVETASSVREALEKLRGGTYDAVISDYQMPVSDGLDLLKIIRLEKRDMPFILFSGKGREEVIIEALNCGADFYVQKGGNTRAQFAELMNMVYQAVLRRQSETELVRSERRLSDIIDFLPDATFVIDRRGKVITWNRAMEEMTGVPAAQVLTKGEYEYAIPFYNERREMLIDLVMASDDELKEKSYKMIRREGNGLVAETVQARPRGLNLHLWVKANPLYDEAGTITGAIETVRDITDIRQAEYDLQEANKKLSLMSSVTLFDIRSRMQDLMLNTDLAAGSKDPAESARYLEQVSKNSREILRQIDFARDYEDLGITSPCWQNVADVISRVLEQRDYSGIMIDYPLHNLECCADPLFERVFDNLIDNALKYGGGVKRISFFVSDHAGGLILVCEDDGIGIPADEKERIFELGYGKNTGLGLFLVREILAITGITIRENSLPGRGARFEILLPSGKFRFNGDVQKQNPKKPYVGSNALHTS
jgi:signal transduction histidine kinase